MSQSKHEVAVCIVTWNSAADLPDCLRAVAKLGDVAVELCVVDNASRDGSAELVEETAATLGLNALVLRNGSNEGFAAAMNQALAATDADWVLALNPDARPAPDYVRRLIDCARPDTGALTGRLVRPDGQLDACGMVLRRAWRHLDRGSGEPDDGRYGDARRVFGATGAAALYRRAALLDVALPGDGDLEIFDRLFHSYREDAELCFRLHERGWSVLYEPAARCEHRRAVLASNRRRTAGHVNLHSLKNRYLLRAYHQTAGNLLRTLPWTLPRDLGALLWVLAVERSSLGAYAWLWRHRRRWLERARIVRSRRTHHDGVERWFRVDSLPI